MGHKTINVTQEHIDLGMPENSAMCMVSEAIKSCIPGARKVHSDMQTLRFTDDKGVRRTFLTPSSVQAALVRFDAGDEVQPFNFKLPRPLHISTATPTVKGGEKRITETVARNSLTSPRPRVGGRGVPLGNSTRRKFGIRNLRINAEGKVIQTGTEE